MTRIKAALTRKLGPLPAWAWLAIVGVGAYLYERRKSSANAGTTNTPTDSALTGSSTDTGAGSGGGFSGGGGSSGGGSSGDGGGGMGSSGPPATPPDTGPIQTPPLEPSPPDQSPPPDAGGGATVQPPSAIRIPKLTQPPTQTFLQWGGQTFTTQAAFAAWARAHGSSVAKELANHPGAAAIYSNLGKSPATAPTIFLPRRGGSGTSQPVPPRTTPVSVRSTPPRPTIRTTTGPAAVVTPARTRSSSKPIAAGAVRGGGSPTAPAAAPKPQPKPAAPHYFTYKKDVQLKQGQTLHFTSGKGYYAG